MMNLNALKIDPEFQGKIPPLNFEEEQQLEQNILHEGRLLNPIIIWNPILQRSPITKPTFLWTVIGLFCSPL